MAQQQRPPQQPQVNPVSAVETVVNTIHDAAMQNILRAALPKDGNLQRFTDAAAAALRNNPVAFHDCNKVSLYNAIADAARKGVIPDGKRGAITVFNTKVRSNPDVWEKRAQFMIMPEGIIEAFNKAGIDAYAQSVYENDEFRFWADDEGQHVEHNFNPFLDRGARIGAYASGKRKNSRTYVEAMSNDELKRARSKSRTPDKGPWVEFPERMEQKSALHRLDKRMPGAGVIGDEDAEPEQIVAGVAGNDETSVETGNADGTGGNQQTNSAVEAITDESRRPRGLQAIIDSEPENVEVGQAYTQDRQIRNSEQGEVIQQSPNGAPF
jgi:recombination protein RecT